MIKKTLIFLFSLLIGFGCTQPSVVLDSRVRSGQLPNGFSFRIQHNEKPKHHASLKLVVKTGSVHEDDDQQGIAHFTEHMAFNGSKHFPDNRLIDFLEKTGVAYGPELNAYTSFEETVYKLEIPLNDPQNLTTALQVIEDWAFSLTLDDSQIDKEREVILQERRDRLSAWSRYQDEYLKLLFNGSRFAFRFPIGLPEIVKHAPYDRLKDFYRRWYTPDRMALIAVGDFDAKALEEQIRLQFSSYPPADPPLSVDTSIPDTDSSDYLIQTHREFEEHGLFLFTRQNQPSLPPIDTIRFDTLQTLAALILSQRFDERLNCGRPGIVSAFVSDIPFNADKSFFLTALTFKEADALNAIETFFIEKERLCLYGATEAELSQAKAALSRQIRTQVAEQRKLSSQALSDRLTDHFLFRQPDFDPAWYGKTALRTLQTATLSSVTPHIPRLLSPSNRVVALFAPDTFQSRLPSQATLEQLERLAHAKAALPPSPPLPTPATANPEAAEVTTETPTAKPAPPSASPSDTAAGATAPAAAESTESAPQAQAALHLSLPKPGKIIQTTRIPELDAFRFTLSNRAVVLFRPSTLTQNRFALCAVSKGGTSLASDADFPSAELADDLFAYAPLANLSRTEKLQWFAREGLSPSLSIDELTQSLTVSGSASALEAAFQWIYAAFLPLTAAEDEFQTVRSNYLSYAAHAGNDPETYFSRELNEILRPKKDRNPLMLPEVAERAQLQPLISFYNDRFHDASDFTFILTGNLPLKRLKKLMTRYLAVLPSDANRDNAQHFLPVFPKYPAQSSRTVFNKGHEDRALIYTLFTQDHERDYRLSLTLQAGTEMLTRLLTKEIREAESGTYSIGAFSRLNQEPYEELMGGISFSCRPDRLPELIQKRDALLQRFLEGQFDDPLLSNYQTIFHSQWEQNQQSDSYWLSVLTQYALGLLAPDDFAATDNFVQSLSTETVLSAAKQLFRQSVCTTAILLPE